MVMQMMSENINRIFIILLNCVQITNDFVRYECLVVNDCLYLFVFLYFQRRLIILPILINMGQSSYPQNPQNIKKHDLLGLV